METFVSEAFETMPEGRYNWQHLMLRVKYNYRIFRNPKTIQCVKDAFSEIEQNFGFKIREIGFGEDLAHVHMVVEVPSKFSMCQTLQIFKSHSASRVFERIPNLKKRYPRGEFWSGYRYNGSVGPMTFNTVKSYIQKQDVLQKTLGEFQ